MEKTDPEHERKEAEVLHVYREVKTIREEGSEKLSAILSYDEKPGIQAIGNIYPDKQPDEDHGYVSGIMITGEMEHYPFWQGSIS